jgi:hypothetical protein
MSFLNDTGSETKKIQKIGQSINSAFSTLKGKFATNDKLRLSFGAGPFKSKKSSDTTPKLNIDAIQVVSIVSESNIVDTVKVVSVASEPTIVDAAQVATVVFESDIIDMMNVVPTIPELDIEGIVQAVPVTSVTSMGNIIHTSQHIATTSPQNTFQLVQDAVMSSSETTFQLVQSVTAINSESSIPDYVNTIQSVQNTMVPSSKPSIPDSVNTIQSIQNTMVPSSKPSISDSVNTMQSVQNAIIPNFENANHSVQNPKTTGPRPDSENQLTPSYTKPTTNRSSAWFLQIPDKLTANFTGLPFVPITLHILESNETDTLSAKQHTMLKTSSLSITKDPKRPSSVKKNVVFGIDSVPILYAIKREHGRRKAQYIEPTSFIHQRGQYLFDGSNRLMTKTAFKRPFLFSDGSMPSKETVFPGVRLYHRKRNSPKKLFIFKSNMVNLKGYRIDFCKYIYIFFKKFVNKY